MHIPNRDARAYAAALVLIALATPFPHGAPGQWSFTRGDTGRLAPCAWLAPTPTVDGRLDDWADRLFAVTLDDAHMGGSNHAHLPVIGGDRDCSGKVALGWDGTFLYVALRAVDDALAPIDGEEGYRRPGVLTDSGRAHAGPLPAASSGGRRLPKRRLDGSSASNARTPGTRGRRPERRPDAKQDGE